MSSGLTFDIFYVQQGPDAWATELNYNFSLLTGGTSSSSGNTFVSAGTNINVSEILSSSTDIFTVSVVQNPIFNSISATTLSASTIYSGSTNLYDIFATLAESGTTNSSNLSQVMASVSLRF